MIQRRSSNRMWPALTALWLSAAACDAPSEPAQRITAGDPELYASYVQPYLEVGCATLDCHGDLGHPLRLFSELGLRSDAALRPEAIWEQNEPRALTERELEDNRLSLASLALAGRGPAEHLALLKPLAVSAGGIAHVGPTLWASTQAPGYLCLRAYLLGDDAGDAPDVCAEALATLEAAKPAVDD